MNCSSASQVRNRSLWWCCAATLSILVGIAFLVVRYQASAPRRNALALLANVERTLISVDPSQSLPLFHLPSAAAEKAPAEQARWLSEILRDEISPEGLAELQRHGRFGPLAEIFPEEAKRWAESAHLPVESCVAFRMERDGIRAEVVLHQTPAGFRVVRYNNVKQMAPPVPHS